MTEKKKFLDVRESIKSKNPGLLKVMPPFVLKFIRKTIHEDKLNQILEDHEGISGLEFVHSIVHNVMKIKPQLHGFENVPEQGRFIFAANHPWGAMEAVTLIDVVAQKYKEPRFIVNDLLMSIKNYHPLFLPVNKHGAQGRENAKVLEENFESDKQILVFPAGIVSRRKKGKIIDPPWQKTFITKAIQHKRDIIPVYFDGRNSNFFYNLANFRTSIGLKANLEMFYLVDEMMKNTNKDLPIYFGKPITYTKFDNTYTRQEWADKVKAHVYSLKDDCKKSF
jgi:1-acyl-sn-glycerol-3-phosphate acyltransferase